MLLSPTIHRSIHELDKHDWDAVVGEEQIWQTHAALALVEGGSLARCDPRYIVLRDSNGAIAAHTVAYLVDTDLVIFAQGATKSIVDFLRRLAPRFLKVRIVESGWLLSPGNPICRRDDVPLGMTLPALIECLDRIASESGFRFVVVRDFVDEEMAALAPFLHAGFRPIPNLPTTILDVEWRTFDEYLQAMHRDRRQAVRGDLRIAMRNDLSAVVTTDFSDLAEVLSVQWNSINSRAKELKLEPLTPAFYRQIGTAFGSGCRVVKIFKGTELVAHALVVLDGSLLRWLFFGRDGSDRRDGAYFLAISTIVKLAIAEGAKRIEMGLTTYSVKLDFGAKMIGLTMLVRSRGLPTSVLSKAFKLLNPVPHAVSKIIFKLKSGGS